jgi:hypothetical protein
MKTEAINFFRNVSNESPIYIRNTPEERRSHFHNSGSLKLRMSILFFFQALSFLVESFGLLNNLFPLPSILDAGYPVFDLYLADVLCDVILPSVLGSSL